MPHSPSLLVVFCSFKGLNGLPHLRGQVSARAFCWRIAGLLQGKMVIIGSFAGRITDFAGKKSKLGGRVGADFLSGNRCQHRIGQLQDKPVQLADGF
jgi:hypothetical protein